MRTPFSGELEIEAALWNAYADYNGKILYYFHTNRERREACVVFRPKGDEDADNSRTIMGIVTIDGSSWGASCKQATWTPPRDTQEVIESMHLWNLFSFILCFFDYAEEFGSYNLITNNSRHFRRGLHAKMEMQGAMYTEKADRMLQGTQPTPGDYTPIRMLNSRLKRGYRILVKK